MEKSASDMILYGVQAESSEKRRKMSMLDGKWVSAFIKPSPCFQLFCLITSFSLPSLCFLKKWRTNAQCACWKPN